MTTPQPFSEHRMGLLMRVSSKQQEYKSQLARARKHFAREGLEFPPDRHVYAEKQSSFRYDSLAKRVRTQALLADIEAGQIVGFFALRVNRFSRNARLGLEIYDRLLRAHARVVFIENPKIDIYSHEGREWFLGEQAKAETELLGHARRVRDGKAATATKGQTNASRAGFGAVKRRGVLRWVKPGALIVRDALNWFHDEETTTCTDISDRLLEKYGERFTAQTIRRWIRSPRYYGRVRHAPSAYGRTHATTEEIARAPLVRAAWKPLVKPSKYAPNIAKLSRLAHGGKGAHRPDPRARHAYAFGGGDVLRCALCGGSMFGEMRLRSSKPAPVYAPGYLCSNAKRFHTCSAGGRSVLEADLERQIGELFAQIVPPADWIAQIAAAARQLQADDREAHLARRSIQRRREAAAQDLARRRITIADYAALDEGLTAEEAAIAAAPKAGITEAQIAALVEQLRSLLPVWHKADGQQRRQLVHQIFAAMWVDVVRKRVVRIEARPEWAALLRTVQAFRPIDGDVFAVRVPQPAIERVIQDALAELGQATAYAIAEHTGADRKAIRLALRAMHDAGVIEAAGFAMLPVPYVKRARVWCLRQG